MPAPRVTGQIRPTIAPLTFKTLQLIIAPGLHFPPNYVVNQIPAITVIAMTTSSNVEAIR